MTWMYTPSERSAAGFRRSLSEMAPDGRAARALTERSRRLATLEATLGPKALVLDWLTEAQQYDGFDAYFQAQLDERPTQMPLDRLVEAAINGSAARTRGASERERAEAREHDLRLVAYRFYLVLQSWTMTLATLDRETLIYTIVVCVGGLYLVEDDAPAIRESHLADRLGLVRKLADYRVNELHALQLARERIAAEHFDGRALLIPGMERAWAKQVRDSEKLAVMAVRLAELDGLSPLEPEAFEPREELISRRVADQVKCGTGQDVRPARRRCSPSAGTPSLGWTARPTGRGSDTMSASCSADP